MFGFESGICCLLIAPVPVHCFLIPFFHTTPLKIWSRRASPVEVPLAKQQTKNQLKWIAYCMSFMIWAATWEKRSSGVRPGPTQTGLCSHRRWLEAWNFTFRKKRKCTIQVAKTKALISFAVVTAKLICAFVFRICKSPVFSSRGSYHIILNTKSRGFCESNNSRKYIL